MNRTFTAIYQQRGVWWIGTVEEVPGAISQEQTLEEVRASLVEAVQLILDVNREYASLPIDNATILREMLVVPVPA